jgi:predicted PurR-regulated permease PerM
MIIFLLGVSATVVVGILVWLTIGAIKVSKKVKSIEEEMRNIWMDIESRYNSIERDRHDLQEATDRRIDGNISYIDSRLDKLINEISNKFITKKDKLDNTVNY